MQLSSCIHLCCWLTFGAVWLWIVTDIYCTDQHVERPHTQTETTPVVRTRWHDDEQCPLGLVYNMPQLSARRTLSTAWRRVNLAWIDGQAQATCCSRMQIVRMIWVWRRRCYFMGVVQRWRFTRKRWLGGLWFIWRTSTLLFWVVCWWQPIFNTLSIRVRFDKIMSDTQL